MARYIPDSEETRARRAAWTPERLQEYRVSIGMTRTEFAEVLGIARSALVHWEQGQRNISLSSVKKIERYQRQRANCGCSCHEPKPERRQFWTPREEQVIREVIEDGGRPEEVIRRLRDEQGRQRTRIAVVTRAWELGLSFDNNAIWLTTTDVARRLGLSRHQVARLISRKELVGSRYIAQKTGGKHRFWRVHIADLETYQHAQ